MTETPTLKQCLNDLDIRNPQRRRRVGVLVDAMLKAACDHDEADDGAADLFAAACIIRKVCLLMVDEQVATMAATPISTSVN